MRVDHVSYAAEPDGSIATAERLGAQLGITPVLGGVHPRFGTRNMILPLAHERYVEVVEVLDHPASDKAPFGQAVRQRTADGGGWLGWVVAVDDIDDVARRIDREPVAGSRIRPDGARHSWRQLGVKGLLVDPQLPYYIQWDADSQHPSAESQDSPVAISRLQIAGDPQRIADWLAVEPQETSSVIDFDFVSPKGTPGLMSVTFTTPDGDVTI